MEFRRKKKREIASIFPFILFCVITGCNTVSDNRSVDDPSREWLIPVDEVIDTGKDGIPAIDTPVFAPVSEIDYVDEQRFVVGIRIGDEIRAYPHQILDFHEVVNDQIEGKTFSITYCPLTGTAIGWNNKVGAIETTFGVAGLFRNNLILYDRETDSRWSQMLLKSVHGEMGGTNVNTIPVLETTWSTWKQIYPDSKVLTTDTGFDRNYHRFAYGAQYLREDSGTLFLVRNEDPRLKKKVRVHGIIDAISATENSAVQVFVIKDFAQGVNVIQDDIFGSNLIVIGSSDKNFAVSYERTLPDGTVLEMEPVQDQLPVILEDQEGNRWDLFGYAVEGPRQLSGERLTPVRSFSGYWFAWADFFPGLDIYGNP